jgi:hypothetical protein
MLYLYKDDGTPFANDKSAKSAATRKGLTEYEVIEVAGGYSVKYKERCEADLVSPITEEAAEAKTADTCEVDELDGLAGLDKGVPTERVNDEPTEIDLNEMGELELSARDKALAVQWTEPKDAFAMYDQYRDPAFVYKWANPKGKQGARVDELKFQGWRVDDVMYRHISKFARSDMDRVGRGLGTETWVFGHILMRLPRTAAEVRNATYQERAVQGLKDVQEEHEKQVGKDRSYGKITLEM